MNNIKEIAIQSSNLENKIFDYVKNLDWNNIKKIIEKYNIDYNIQDNSNTYLLEYLIVFNKHDIIKILLEQPNIKIDIVDESNKSLLYTVIKFNYIDILNLLLNYKNIGNSITEIQDNDGNTSLFYCIQFNNIESLEIILKNTNNLYVKNNNGYNILHYSVIKNKFDFFKIIHKFINNINILTNNGETVLILAIKYKCYEIIEYLIKNTDINFNIQDTKFHLTALHYIALNNSLSILEIIDDKLKSFDGNLQDNSGNIFYHYFINNLNTIPNKDISKFYKLYNKISFDYNIYNIDGNTCCHILFEKEDVFETQKIITDNLLINTNLNIQNNNGNSCLFLLCKMNYIPKDILINKKLNIYVINYKNNIIFDFIKDKKYFIDIVIDSYIHYLKSNTNITFYLDVDNKCKKDMTKNCIDKISKRIKLDIDYFIKNKKIKNTMFSYPVKKIYPQLIKKMKDIKISTFTSSTINIFCGLIFLEENENTITSLQFVKNKNILNCSKFCDLDGFQLKWINSKLYDPFENNLEKYIFQIKNEDKKTFIIIPLGIQIITETEYFGHSNSLIIDLRSMEICRYETYGGGKLSFNYNPNLLDNILEMKFKYLKYISPKEYLPKISLQYKEINELKSDFIGDPDGYCSSWAIFFSYMTVSYPDIDRKKLSNLLNKEIINNQMSYRQLIRNFSWNITQIRDKILKDVDLNINDYENDIVSKEQVKKLNEILFSYCNN